MLCRMNLTPGHIFGETQSSLQLDATNKWLDQPMLILLSDGFGKPPVNICIKLSSGFLKDRLSTRELLRRKNMYLQSYDCVVLSQYRGNSDSPLPPLSIGKACWQTIQVQLSDGLHPYLTFESFKDQVNVPFFMESIILMSRSIWMARNDLIFKGCPPTVDSVKRGFKQELSLAALRAPATKSLLLD